MICVVCVSDVDHLKSHLNPNYGLFSQVCVLYFAKSVELTGLKDEELVLPRSVSSQDLWRLLTQRHPRYCRLSVQHLHFCVCTHLWNVFCVCVCVCRLSELQGQVVLAVRQQYISIDEQLVSLGDGDEVAVVPPLSGG